MNWLKWVLYPLLALIGLMVLAIVLLVTLVDPNGLKPELEKQAAAQQLDLSIEGDIEWQFFPSIGLRLGATELGSEASGSQPLVRLELINFGLQVAPLFAGQIAIDDLSIQGVDISYHIDEQGVSNWDALLVSDETEVEQLQPEQTETASNSTDVPAINITQIRIEDINLDYSDAATQTDLSFELVSLILNNVNLQGETFTLAAKFAAELEGLPHIAAASDASMRYDAAKGAFDLQQMKITTTINKNAAITTNLQAKVALEPLDVAGVVAVSSDQLAAIMQAFEVELPEGVLLETALQSFGVSTDFSFDGTTATLNKTSIKVDTTELTGQSTIILDESAALPSIETQWQSALVDTNLFLQPAPEEAAAEPETETVDVAEAEPQALPFELLRQLNLSADVNIAKLLYQQLPVENIVLKIRANDGVVALSTLSAAIEDGAVAAQAELDATNDEAQLVAKASTVDLDLGFIASKAAAFENLGGLLNMQLNAKSHGASDLALTDNLSADITAESPQLRIQPMNLIESVCKAVSLAEQKPMEQQDWPAYTRLTPMKLSASLKNNVANIASFTAAVEEFNANATGSYDLSNGDFDVPFQLKLADAAESVKGCATIDEKWRKIALPLRCKGNVDAIGPAVCLPDKAMLTDLVKQRAKQELEKQKDKLEEKVKAKLKDKIGEQGGELLRGLFGR